MCIKKKDTGKQAEIYLDKKYEREHKEIMDGWMDGRRQAGRQAGRQTGHVVTELTTMSKHYLFYICHMKWRVTFNLKIIYYSTL